MKTLTVMLGVALAAGLSEAAVEPDWDNLTYVTLTATDPGGGANSSCIPANSSRWSDQLPVHGDAHYYVGLDAQGKGIRLNGPGNNLNPVNWAGLSLSVAGMIDFNVEKFYLETLRLLGGCQLTQPSSGALTFTNCYVKASSADKPVEFGTSRTSSSGQVLWPVSGAIHGDAAQVMLFHRLKGQMNSAINLQKADFSDFLGRVVFGTGGDGDVGGTNYIGNLVMPGTLEVQDKSFLAMASENYAAQVANLDLKAGSTLTFAVADNSSAANCKAAAITVTASFSAGTGVKIRPLFKSGPGTSTAYLAADHLFPVLKLTGTAAQNPPEVSGFELENWPARFVGDGCSPFLRYEDIAGGKALCVVYPAVNIMNKTNKSLENSASTNVACWTFGRLPEAGEEAFSSTRFVPVQNGTGSSFQGKRLYLYSANSELALYGNNSPYFVDELYMLNGGFVSASFDGKICTYTGNGIWIYGTEAEPSAFESACASTLIVQVPCKGSGKLRLSTKTGTSSPCGWISLLADNSEFSGPLFITCGRGNLKDGKYPRDPATGMVLGLDIQSGGNLGGAMADGQFAWNGVEIESCPLVKMTNSVTFAEPTRGFFINGAPRFVLTRAEDELTFRASVTYCGTFIFGNDHPNTANVTSPLGAGLLTFAAPAYFHAPGETGVHDAPVAGTDTNNLQVLAGSVRATATNGLDGVAITFGPEAEGIRVSTDAEGELADYGLYNVKWAVPFASQRADGKIPVRVGAVNEVYADTVKTLAVCTVSGAAAASLTKDSFVVTAKPEGARTKMLDPQTRDDGTVTYSLRVTVAGLRIFVK